MKKTLFLYALLLAVAGLALQWLETRFWMRAISIEAYVVILALGFTALGIWVGHRLTHKAPDTPFEINQAALTSLGVSKREHDVLMLMAEGQSVKEIARSLGISPNTVKTHTSRLYEKLDVQRKMQAVQKAQSLRLVP